MQDNKSIEVFMTQDEIDHHFMEDVSYITEYILHIAAMDILKIVKFDSDAPLQAYIKSFEKNLNELKEM